MYTLNCYANWEVYPACDIMKIDLIVKQDGG